MFKTYEIAIMAAVVMLMLVTVWAFRTESSLSSVFQSPDTQTAAIGQITVGDDTTWQAALRDSVNDRGQLRNLIIDTIDVGEGDPVAAGDTVTVHYVGTLANGEEFDNSRQRGEPFTFTVGRGSVIAGWEEGVLGMRPGGTRILVIPPELGYGQAGYGPIPGNATLVFTVELLSVR